MTASRRIFLRFTSGARSGQNMEVPLAGLSEITFGRESDNRVRFDAEKDRMVSRRHAVIKILGGEVPSFKLSDLGSSNGTSLNGSPLTQEVEILPGDTVTLGVGGPQFIFDVNPRSQKAMERTQVLGGIFPQDQAADDGNVRSPPEPNPTTGGAFMNRPRNENDVVAAGRPFIAFGVLAGCLLGYPISYFFQPQALRMKISMGQYISHFGDVMGSGDLNGTAIGVWIACVVLFGAVGAAIERIQMDGRQSGHR